MPTWLVLLAAGVGGLGLGMGLVIGSAIVRNLRDASGGDDEFGRRHRRD